MTIKKEKTAHFYDWRKTCSYNAPITMVVGARGIGKTYGLRKRCIEQYLNKGLRFVEIVRHAKELDGNDSIIDGYFDKLEENAEFPQYMFKTSKHAGYIAKVPTNENESPQWEQCMYFVALTNEQDLKKKTYANVGNGIFDEAIIDRADRYHNYLSNEYDKVANLVSTITRQLAHEETQKISFHLYLLGNACDLMNPYFQAMKIDKEPDFGYSWHDSKLFLLHYVKDAAYSKALLKNTIAGRMVRNREESQTMAGNHFKGANEDFIALKSPTAKFDFGLNFEGHNIGFWIDWNEGYCYVCTKIPNNTIEPVFTLTTQDNRINYIAAERSNPYLKSIMRMYHLGILRYDSPATRERFRKILRILGIR